MSSRRLCGQLACQRDSYLRTLRTTVLACEPTPSTSEPSEPSHHYYRTVLADTVLFPEGGGQPCDHGTIGGLAVRSVVNDGGVAVHTVVVGAGASAGCQQQNPFEVGAEVDVVVDWQRRYDLMCQHSAQHLVTALAIEHFDLPTISWNLGESVSFLELGSGKGKNVVSQEQVDVLERHANELIKDARPMTARWVEPDDEEFAAIRSRGIPDGVTGPVRVVEIAGVDSNTCCGTHVQNLSMMGSIKLLHVESTPRGCKVWYVAGDRVRTLLGRCWEQQRRMTSMLTVPPEQHAERLTAIMNGQRAQNKSVKTLQQDLAELTVRDLVATNNVKAERAVAVHREGGNKDFLASLVSGFAECAAKSGKIGDAVLLATVGAPSDGMFALAGPADRVAEAGPQVAALLGGRGGGRKGKYQGKGTALGERNRAQALDLLRGGVAVSPGDIALEETKR